VIDDEVALVRAYRRLLSRKHNIVAAYGGDEALSILAHDRDFDLILCDMMMPGTDGTAIYDALLKSDPELLERIVFSSGGPTSKRAQTFLRQPGIVFLEKPISSDALIQFISHRTSTGPLRRPTAAPKTHPRELRDSIEIQPAIKQR
jgi:DNA-binding NtrC family response regulator